MLYNKQKDAGTIEPAQQRDNLDLLVEGPFTLSRDLSFLFPFLLCSGKASAWAIRSLRRRAGLESWVLECWLSVGQTVFYP